MQPVVPLPIETDEAQRAEQRRANEAAIQLLRSWREGDSEEQRETLAYLQRVLDEDRPSDRKLFP